MDDELSELVIVKRFLKQVDPTIQVESVSSPREALQMLKEPFDCVVSDYKMPGMDGIELAYRIRETSSIPFIIYTGRGSEDVAESAFAAGIDDYIRKEIDCGHYQLLANHIRHLVEKHRSEEALRARAKQYEDHLTALHDSSRRLAEARSLEEVVEGAIDAMRQTLGFEVAAYMAVEDECLVTVALQGAEMLRLKLPLDGLGVTVKAARTGRSILLTDTREDPDYAEGAAPALSELAVPVKVDGEVVAVLNVESTQTGAYNDNDRILLETLAMHVASAIRNIRQKTELQRNLEELERSNRELDDYTYAVSHDLKAPLRSIRAYSKFLQIDYADKLDESGQEYLKSINDASLRIKRFIQDLLLLSRVGRKYTETEKVDLNNLLQEIEQDFEAQIKERGAEILVDRLPTIKTQRVWMRQLFSNLISNGLKFNKSPTPRVEVGCEERRGDYMFSVMDNGIGIKKRDQEKLFKIFHRLHTQEEYPGTGAGLATCKKIVESFGGEIWVESKPGAGSTFYFTYPKEGVDETEAEHPSEIDQGILRARARSPVMGEG